VAELRRSVRAAWQARYGYSGERADRHAGAPRLAALVSGCRTISRTRSEASRNCTDAVLAECTCAPQNRPHLAAAPHPSRASEARLQGSDACPGRRSRVTPPSCASCAASAASATLGTCCAWPAPAGSWRTRACPQARPWRPRVAALPLPAFARSSALRAALRGRGTPSALSRLPCNTVEPAGLGAAASPGGAGHAGSPGSAAAGRRHPCAWRRCTPRVHRRPRAAHEHGSRSASDRPSALPHVYTPALLAQARWRCARARRGAARRTRARCTAPQRWPR